jgi:hypothetical protein
MRRHMPVAAPALPHASSKLACASACWAHAGPRPTTSAAQDLIQPEPDSNLIQTKPEPNPNHLQKKKRKKKKKKEGKNSKKMQNFQHSSEDPRKSLFALKTFKCVNLILVID